MWLAVLALVWLLWLVVVIGLLVAEGRRDAVPVGSVDPTSQG
ncbi:hypothetical protein [Halalkalicoccus jeotgali]|uniref:Uncharacterized protein n=1 Tax=Halalkalicoccus jeotgali (strain DSM 18796 / CECT 7217 / JCM 14584 / KCTC 4019 / B3) TaxID=795797 RepID=D8J5T6_HALJB|nr:hypothetical protein [Halalkalicoccus jeotgali]ADJ13742.1 hypothetical protein HacjB3_01745 [Halalkalicoccus jeotgali B3]ELY34212.1 hypothetical protein C497_17572 [Halalkalicoccus jeotgali B3]